MQLVTSSEMRRIEESMFARGVDAWELMVKAGRGTGREILDFLRTPGVAVIHGGKGNNGGDAWVAAQVLLDAGWRIRDAGFTDPELMSPLCRRAWDAVRERISIGGPTGREDLIVDGMLGTGSSGALRGDILHWCKAINRQRGTGHAMVCAVDLPTGLNGDTGEVDPAAVRADFTVTLGLPKRGLVADRAVDHVGSLRVVDLGMMPESPGNSSLACPAEMRRFFWRRAHSAHKGDSGRVAIVAGSKGFAGAAVLCATGALRAGAGLVSLLVPEEIYEVAAIKAPPEVMVKPWSRADELSGIRADAWVVGPGTGRERELEVREFLQNCKVPVVLDADGLNILAAHPPLREALREDWILTPHEGEMQRLIQREPGESRLQWADRFSAQYPPVLLLKGPRTLVRDPSGRVSYNSTGNAGMASGGTGDVLAGVTGALAGQGYAAFDAARTGAWLTGRAAELLVATGAHSMESLLASDLAGTLGAAFTELLRGDQG